MSAKYYAKRFLKGIGKAFLLLGKGIWFVIKAIGKETRREYRNYQERQRIEAIRREHYRGIERENYAAGRGWARGISDVQEEGRIRRQNEHDRREAQRRFENQMFPKLNEHLFDVPRVNENFWTEDLEPKKRKKRRNILEL